MEKTYHQIDGKIYYLDLNAIFNLIVETPSNEKQINTTISQTYGDDDVIGKEIVEDKSNLNETMNQVRYDLIKNLMGVLFQSNMDSDGAIIGLRHLNEMSFAQGLCFNTLIEHKILVEVECDD